MTTDNMGEHSANSNNNDTTMATEPRHVAESLSPASAIANENEATPSAVSSLSPQMAGQMTEAMSNMTDNFFTLISDSRYSMPLGDQSAISDGAPMDQDPNYYERKTEDSKAPAPEEDKKFNSLKELRCSFCHLRHPRIAANSAIGVSPCVFVRFLSGTWGSSNFSYTHSKRGKPQIYFTGGNKPGQGPYVVMFPNKEPLVSWLRLEVEMAEGDRTKKVWAQDEMFLGKMMEKLLPPGTSQAWSEQKVNEARALHLECVQTTQAAMDKQACILAVRGKISYAHTLLAQVEDARLAREKTPLNRPSEKNGRFVKARPEMKHHAGCFWEKPGPVPTLPLRGVGYVVRRGRTAPYSH